MATIQPLLAKILIQVGADEPKEIGTIEIPIEVNVPERASRAVNINAPELDTEALKERLKADVERRLKYYGTV